jgi:predicted small lipoprotein YifL
VKRIPPHRAARQGAPCTLVAAVASLMIAGCGYKAPLYLPKPKPERTRPAPTVVTPEPSPDRPAPSEAAPSPQ